MAQIEYLENPCENLVRTRCCFRPIFPFKMPLRSSQNPPRGLLWEPFCLLLTFLGPPWAPFWAPMIALWPSLDHPLASLSPLLGTLGACWEALGRSRAILGGLWLPTDLFREDLGRFWYDLGCDL